MFLQNKTVKAETIVPSRIEPKVPEKTSDCETGEKFKGSGKLNQIAGDFVVIDGVRMNIDNCTKIDDKLKAIKLSSDTQIQVKYTNIEKESELWLR